MTNFLQYLEATAERVPNKVAFKNEVDSLTFDETITKAKAIGSFLSSKGYYKAPVSVFMKKHPNTIA